MDIIPMKFSYRKLYKLVDEFAEKYEYDLPIVNVDVRHQILNIRVHLYNSPEHKSFTFNYGTNANNSFNYDSFIKALEQSFERRYEDANVD